MENEKEYYWWADEKYKTTVPFPLSIINDNGTWVATFNNDTNELLGDRIHVCTQADSKEEAILSVFKITKMLYSFQEEDKLNFQRFVPFIKGSWKETAGKWFTIFGIQFYFRYGKEMQGGWYIPFTKINISITNYWKVYRNFKNEKAKKKS